jgi:hypothetical protein
MTSCIARQGGVVHHATEVLPGRQGGFFYTRLFVTYSRVNMVFRKKAECITWIVVWKGSGSICIWDGLLQVQPALAEY